MASFFTGRVVRVEISEASHLLPEFTASAQRHDIGSYLAAPLTVD
jgi:hypothetical protein